MIHITLNCIEWVAFGLIGLVLCIFAASIHTHREMNRLLDELNELSAKDNPFDVTKLPGNGRLTDAEFKRPA